MEHDATIQIGAGQKVTVGFLSSRPRTGEVEL